jgi:hypothetical protein
VARFDAAVSESQTAVAAALGSVVVAGAQSGTMAGARKSYDSAIASLKALVTEGHALELVVQGYKTELVFPDDFGAAGQAGLSSSTFLEQQPCYRDSRNLVITYAEILGLHSKELALTAKIAQGLAAKALKGEGHLKPEDILPLLRSNPAQGAGTPAGKPVQQNQSDITGTNKSDKAAPTH